MTLDFPLEPGGLYEHLKEVFDPADRYLVAVSGGGDSLALLLLMLPEEERERKRVVVGHVHHGTGTYADRAEQYVKSIAGQFGLHGRVARVTIDPEREKTVGFEAAAREQRHPALQRMADSVGADRILLAHTRDDLAETVLLQMLRGSGLSGLASLKRERGRVLRPLLEVSAEQLRRLLAEHDLQALEDPANADERFARVRVRTELGPLIRREFGAGAWENIARSARYLTDAEAVIDEEAERIFQDVVRGSTPRWLSIDATVLRGYFDELALRVLRRAIAQVRQVAPERVYLDRRRRLQLLYLLHRGEGDRLDLGDVMLSFGSHLELSGFSDADAVVLDLPGEATLGDGSRVRVDLNRANFAPGAAVQGEPSAHGFVERLDARAVGNKVRFRPWREGDRFLPLGSTGEPRKVVRRLRRSPSERIGPLWVMDVPSGDIAWVLGERIADPFKLTDATDSSWIVRYDPPTQSDG